PREGSSRRATRTPTTRLSSLTVAPWRTTSSAARTRARARTLARPTTTTVSAAACAARPHAPRARVRLADADAVAAAQGDLERLAGLGGDERLGLVQRHVRRDVGQQRISEQRGETCVGGGRGGVGGVGGQHGGGGGRER